MHLHEQGKPIYLEENVKKQGIFGSDPDMDGTVVRLLKRRQAFCVFARSQ